MQISTTCNTNSCSTGSRTAGVQQRHSFCAVAPAFVLYKMRVRVTQTLCMPHPFCFLHWGASHPCLATPRPPRPPPPPPCGPARPPVPRFPPRCPAAGCSAMAGAGDGGGAAIGAAEGVVDCITNVGAAATRAPLSAYTVPIGSRHVGHSGCASAAALVRATCGRAGSSDSSRLFSAVAWSNATQSKHLQRHERDIGFVRNGAWLGCSRSACASAHEERCFCARASDSSFR